MICFCCGAEYDETARETVIDIFFPTEDAEAGEGDGVDVAHIKHVTFGGKVLKLCPSCTKACATGFVLTSDRMYLADGLEFEEDET